MERQKIKIVDTTLRDGSHAVSHSFTVDQVSKIARGLDSTGVDLIEISHGDGIGGGSINYGFNKVPELELIKAARKEIKNAKLAILLLPGVGTIEDLKKAEDVGIDAVRVATHVTEADISIQHIRYAKSRGLFTVGFLMMGHMSSADDILEQAKIFEAEGVDYINIADSAGYMTPDEVRKKISTLVNNLHTPIGFHSHNNLGLAMGNSLAAASEGASYLDGTCRGLGAGAGNTQIEVLCAVLKRMGFDNDINIYKLMDVAENIVEPIMHRPQIIRTDSLMLGYAGVYSSFLLHARRASEKYNVEVKDILVELGKRGMVGGQEDMIVDVAYELATKKQ
ncbi:MAG: 4-hydroxy-2-oxovalerate aldolase [Miniphocaeibacter sp.]|uniref:4-hydroxy-2-oxovalerate aldolase n=1 Tax=Miniphocaeibacter sp. TaxID=3100973 RepID=UPI0018513B21|nr:4-hydroxy-2-oxovalerate aldolase [Gallicola sp.]